jgi:hypothetical protein
VSWCMCTAACVAWSGARHAHSRARRPRAQAHDGHEIMCRTPPRVVLALLAPRRRLHCVQCSTAASAWGCMGPSRCEEWHAGGV